MSIHIIPDSYSASHYNELVDHPLQSWEWGDARKKMGLSVYRFGEGTGNSLKKVYQMTIHPIPYTHFSIGYIPRSAFPSSDFVQFLLRFGSKHNIIFIKFEPNVLEENKQKDQLSLKHTTFVPSPHPLFPRWTQVVDISQNEKTLLAQMKAKTRYNIRLAQKKGVTVKEMSDDEGFVIFSKLYFETCKRQHYHGHNIEYHQIVWDSLKHHIGHILVAWYQGTPLASYQLFHFKDKVYYTYGGTSPSHKHVMAANLLMWESILFAQKLGAKTFDMWGSLPPQYDSSHDWAGFTRFKEGYGTSFREYIEGFDLLIKPFFYSLYGIVYSIRQRLLLRF